MGSSWGCWQVGCRDGVPDVTQRQEEKWGGGRSIPARVPPGADFCPCVFVVLPRSIPAPHPTRSLHSSPSAGPFPAHLSCFHGYRFILHSSSHPRYRTLRFCLFTDPLLLSWRQWQEDDGPVLG